MIRYAVIGTNFITDRFIGAAKECSKIQLHGVYSRDINRAREYADKYNATLTFGSLEELAECDEIDMVYIASPNSLHCEQSIRMLTSKKHVLCEKPIASNSEELRKMLQAAKENHDFLPLVKCKKCQAYIWILGQSLTDNLPILIGNQIL